MNVSLVDKTDVFNYMSLILVGKMRKVRKCQKQLMKCWHHGMSTESTES